MILDPFYLALGVFAAFVIFTLTISVIVRKFKNRRRIGTERPSITLSENNEARIIEGPVNLYETKPIYEYDPDLLPLSGNRSTDDTRTNGLSYLTRLPDNNLAIALEQNFYEKYSKK